MNSWQQFLAAYPILQTLWDSLSVMAPLAILLAYCGIYFISATAKIISISRRRSAFDKCARQSALLGLILGWSLLIGGRVWLYLTQSEHVPGSLENFMLEMSWLLFSLGVLFSSIYYCFWRILKNMPVLHSTIGIISAVQNCISLIVILFTIRLAAAFALPQAEGLALPDLFPEAWNAPVWSAACYTIPLIFALAGALIACWLVIRRKADDFGRDYYNQMLRWSASWAKNGWALLWLLLMISLSLNIWLQTREGVFNSQEGIMDVCRALLWLIPCLLWTWVTQAALPLRQSWALFVAAIFAGLFMIPYFLELTML